MADLFPRTNVGGVSMPRMIMGINCLSSLQNIEILYGIQLIKPFLLEKMLMNRCRQININQL